MSDSKHRPESGIEQLIGRLPQTIAPHSDAWPAIEAAITVPAETADAAITRLPAAIAPPDSLWPAIASRLGGQDARPSPGSRLPRHGWLGLAASVALLVVVGLALSRFGGPAVGLSPDAALQQLASGSFDDLRWLSSDIFGRATADSPTVTAEFEAARRTYAQHIIEVRGQRERIEESLALYPDDAALRELWLYAYETELFLIDEAGRILTTI